MVWLMYCYGYYFSEQIHHVVELYYILGFTDGLADVLLGSKAIDDDIIEELETRLITADVGMDVTQKIIADLNKRVSRKELDNADTLMQCLSEDMIKMLKPAEQALQTESKQPFVILVIGINGAGKTTTIGKMAKHFQHEGKTVMLAAGDTFRAAAVEQLKTWGERNDIPVLFNQLRPKALISLSPTPLVVCTPKAT